MIAWSDKSKTYGCFRLSNFVFDNLGFCESELQSNEVEMPLVALSFIKSTASSKAGKSAQARFSNI